MEHKQSFNFIIKLLSTDFTLPYPTIIKLLLAFNNRNMNP